MIWKVSRSPTVPASCFVSRAGAITKFRDCTLSVHNLYRRAEEYHPNLSLIATEAGDVDSDEFHQIRLTNCVVRGEGSFLTIEANTGVIFEWNNGGAVITDQLFRCTKSDDELGFPHRNEFDLRNVALDCRKGVGEVLTGGYRAEIPHVKFNMRDSVVALRPQRPMLHQSGRGNRDDYADRLEYYGHNNRYIGDGLLWEIDSLGDDTQEAYDWELWQRHWQEEADAGEEIDSRFDPTSELEVSDTAPHDTPIYALQRAFGGSFDGGGSGDRPRVGPHFGLLPTIPYHAADQ